ncbi:hypothetical protein QJS04_geneDACA004438 [Acorus gramineus]|uniref:Uncharacterized protein n=1 Tax=Acorus gramineus TaxID=55184 RepID=A0AAV9B1D9_ACOGR|nr:hypothetical protein QJS04_geneDACA004438 [Acorus gramineus]
MADSRGLGEEKPREVKVWCWLNKGTTPVEDLEASTARGSLSYALSSYQQS